VTHANDIKQCLYIHISGIVQGVCFRYYAKMEAQQIGVTGHIRNMPNGDVKAMICGNAKQLKTMQQWLSHGPEMAHVDHIQIREETPEHIPGDFCIT